MFLAVNDCFYCFYSSQKQIILSKINSLVVLHLYICSQYLVAPPSSVHATNCLTYDSLFFITAVVNSSSFFVCMPKNRLQSICFAVLLLIWTPIEFISTNNLHDVILQLALASLPKAQSSCFEHIRFFPYLPLRCGVPFEPCCMF
jgi:hypothetical protein